MLRVHADRSGGRVLRRARQVLVPFPGQASALAAVVAVLAGVGVSAPLMVASGAQGAWEQRESRLSEALGTTVLSATGSPTGGSSVERLRVVPELDEEVAATGGALGLPEPALTTYLAQDLSAGGPAGATGVQLVGRPGYQDGIALLEGEATADGVIAPEELVRRTGAQVGDVLGVFVPGDELTDRAPSQAVEVELTGIYPDAKESAPDFWRGIADLVRWVPNPNTGVLEPPPPALVTSVSKSLEVEQAVDADIVLFWYFPAPDGLLVPQVRDLAAAGEALQSRLVAPGQPVADLVQDVGLVQPTTRTAVPTVLADVDETVDLLSPPVRAVGAGGGLAALALVGAWAGARSRRREGELRALVARGLSPARGGAQAALEAAVPVLVGLVAGGLAGWGAVVWWGPSARLPGQVVAPAAGTVLAAGVAAVALVGVVTAAAVARLGRVGQGPAAQLVGRIPWLPVLAAVTVVVAAPLVLRQGSGPAGEVDLLALVVPLLAVVVVAGAVVALLQRVAPRLTGRVRRLPPAGFLALRRVLTGPGATRLVVVTTALALGLVTYAGALADSTARTIAAKASVAAGSDVVVDLPGGRDLSQAQAALAGSGEPVTVVGQDLRVTVLPGEVTADVLVVDPDRLDDVVRWDGSLAEQPLGELLAALTTGTGTSSGGRVPVIAAGGLASGPVAAVDGQITIDLGGYQVPAQVVARADAFPGQSSLRPLLVAPWEAYTAAVVAADRDPTFTINRQAWARGQVDQVLSLLADAGAASADPEVRTAAEFQQRPALVAQSWSLGYLRAVALAAGLLSLVGLVLHAAAQAQQRTVAVLLLARMGMTTRATATAAALETGLLAVLAAAVAVAVAVPASVLVLGLLDPVPDLPPDPLVAVPWATIALVVAGAVVVAAAAGVLAARTARAASPGQVMRDAD